MSKTRFDGFKDMFILKRVLIDKRLNCTAKFIFAELTTKSNHLGEACLNKKALMYAFKKDKFSINESIKQLQKYGLITIIQSDHKIARLNLTDFELKYLNERR